MEVSSMWKVGCEGVSKGQGSCRPMTRGDGEFVKHMEAAVLIAVYFPTTAHLTAAELHSSQASHPVPRLQGDLDRSSSTTSSLR